MTTTSGATRTSGASRARAARRRESLPAVGSAPAEVERALLDLAAGRPIVLVDDADGEPEGHLVLAAEKATPQLLAFLVRHTSGFVCVALPEADADRLDLPPMPHRSQVAEGAAFTVTVDAADGVTTGISATDRARTIRLLAASSTAADDLRRPGHVVPLRAREGGVLRRARPAEAAVDLARLAGMRPAGALCELVNDDGTLARVPDLVEFCAGHGLNRVRIADLVTYRRTREKQVAAVTEAPIPTAHGLFRAVGYADLLTGAEHVALVMGRPDGGDDVLVRVHAECLTGDVFGSLLCDCDAQLAASLAAVADAGRGVVLYLRAEEGPGGGPLRAARNQQFQAPGAGPFLADHAPARGQDRRHGIAAQILADQGVRRVRLLTDDPAEEAGLAGFGVTVVDRVPVLGAPGHGDVGDVRDVGAVRAERDRAELDRPRAVGHLQQRRSCADAVRAVALAPVSAAMPPGGAPVAAAAEPVR